MSLRPTRSPLSLAMLIACACVPCSALATAPFPRETLPQDTFPRDTRAGQWEVGIAPSYAYVVLGGRSEPSGGGGAVFVRCGLSQTLAFKLSGTWTVHRTEGPDDSRDSTLSVWGAALGLTYAVDVSRWSPKIEAAAGVLHRSVDTSADTDLSFKIGLALDYVLSAWLSVGAEVHYHGLMTDPADLPVYVQIGPRVAFRWP